MEEILKNLKELKQISPSSECALRTEILVRSTPQPKREFHPFLLVSLILVVLVGSIFLFNNKTMHTVYSPKEGEKEISQIDFNIELPRISYYQEIEDIISLALKEIIDK